MRMHAKSYLGFIIAENSVLDPDLDPRLSAGSGSEYGSGKKNHSGSGQIWIRNEFGVKLF
jgi:hypothetical protein